MDIPEHIQQILDKAKAQEIAGYIERRNRRHPHGKATLSLICRRFRLQQTDAIRIIETVPYLVLSEFAYRPEGDNWATQFLTAFYPSLWPDAPLGRRLVFVLEVEGDGEEGAND